MLSIKFQCNEDIRRVSVDHEPSLKELTLMAISIFRENVPESFVLKYKDNDGDNITVTSDVELEEAFRLFREQKILRVQIVPQTGKPVVVAPPQTATQTTETQTQQHAVPTSPSNPLDDFVNAISPYWEAFENQVKDLYPRIENQIRGALPKLEETFYQTFPVQKECNHKAETMACVHNAICDLCEEKIHGIRWKCMTCDNYDLCNLCRGLNVHNEHPFMQIDTPQQPIPRRSQPKEQPKEKPVPVQPKEVAPLANNSHLNIPKETAPASPFEGQLKQLEDMGFSDRQKNLQLLVKNNGDMINVVQELLA